PGATNATFIIASVKLSDAGNYRVVVSNKAGSVTSADAVLKVSSPLADPSVLSNGLVAYLPFDGDYTDLQGNVSAKAVGSPTFDSGKRGQGIHVKNLKDGSLNNYVTLGYPNALKFGDAKDFTVSFWVKQISQADDQAFISNKDWNSSNNRGWGVFSQGGSVIRVQLTGPSTADKYSQKPAANLPDAAWHLITVAVARTGNVDTYVDGTLALSTPMTVKGNIDTDDLGFALNLGQDGTGKYTDGGAAELDAVLDEVAVWNRALNAQEASALFTLGNAGQSIKVPAITQNLEVYLPFDGTYADKSGKGVVASAVGSPKFEAGPIGQAIRVNNLKDGSVNNSPLVGTDQVDRGIPNEIRLEGDVTFGLGGTANHFGGVIDLNGANRTVTLGNTSYFYNRVSNGGLLVDNGPGTGNRALWLYGNNNYIGGTVVRTNAILGLGSDNALGSGDLVFTNNGVGAGFASLRAATLSTDANQMRIITNNIVIGQGMTVALETITSVVVASNTNSVN
ncbi:MAG: hypothetical protein EBU81_12215, partial [Proteobacteria bacterium]|nr:hypothetical protein [Pseudomonadota bacterium]